MNLRNLFLKIKNTFSAPVQAVCLSYDKTLAEARQREKLLKQLQEEVEPTQYKLPKEKYHPLKGTIP